MAVLDSCCCASMRLTSASTLTGAAGEFGLVSILCVVPELVLLVPSASPLSPVSGRGVGGRGALKSWFMVRLSGALCLGGARALRVACA